MELKLNLDRITISGDIIGVGTSFKELSNALRGTKWRAENDKTFRLARVDENGEYVNVAGLFKNNHQTSWRLDTSYHVNDDEIQSLLDIVKLMTNPHFTRIDVCIDIINSKYPNMAHRIYKFGVSERKFSEYFGKNKELQTLYIGSSSSQQQVRYYDKLVERRYRRIPVDPKIKQWERLELQLRGTSTEEWKQRYKEVLKCFKISNLKAIKNVWHRSMLYSLEKNVTKWSEISKSVRAELRKEIKDSNGYDDTLSKKMISYFDENIYLIDNELRKFSDLMNIKM